MTTNGTAPTSTPTPTPTTESGTASAISGALETLIRAWSASEAANRQHATARALMAETAEDIGVLMGDNETPIVVEAPNGTFIVSLADGSIPWVERATKVTLRSCVEVSAT